MSFIQSRLQPKGFLDTALEAVAAAARQKQIALNIALAENLPDSFCCDKSKLTQVLSTLTDQALRRTEIGDITVRLSLSESADGKAPRIFFTIENTGTGMNPDDVRQIIDLDVSVGSWPHELTASDTAVALRMVSKLISLLGGKLVYDCADGKTTRFSFSIPYRQNETNGQTVAPSKPAVPISETPPAPAESQVDAETQGQGVRILVVDDVEENRTLLSIMLGKLGHKVRFCSNGQEAVDLCQKEPFDVILMDIQMPVMDGMEATRRIRAEGANTKTTIYALTASVQKSDELAVLDAGCDDCIAKPVDRKKLERRLQRVAAQINQIKTAEDGGDIVSFLEGDPDYQKAIETFVNNLPGRVEEIRSACETGDMSDLAFKVHTLKGLGGFAGFPVFTEKAKKLEETLKANEIDKLHSQVDELVQLCLRTKLKSST